MEIQDLYTNFYRELLTYCKAMTKSRASAEDLVQETWLRAFTHWEDVGNLSSGQCRAWLYKTRAPAQPGAHPLYQAVLRGLQLQGAGRAVRPVPRHRAVPSGLRQTAAQGVG